MLKIILENRKELIGAIIGLARATEGNKNRPTQTTNEEFLRGIKILTLSESVYSLEAGQQIKRLHEEKYKLVEKCLTCEKKCGRNDDYNIDNIEEIKKILIEKCILLGVLVKPLDKKALDFLYNAFYLVGSQASKNSILKEINIAEELLSKGKDMLS